MPERFCIVIHTPNKGFISRIYEELQISKTKTTQAKQRHFVKEGLKRTVQQL